MKKTFFSPLTAIILFLTSAIGMVSCNKSGVSTTIPKADSCVVLRNDRGDNSQFLPEAHDAFNEADFEVWGEKYDTAHFKTAQLVIKVPKQYVDSTDDRTYNYCVVYAFVKSEKVWSCTGSYDIFPFKEITLIFAGPANVPTNPGTLPNPTDSTGWVWEIKKITPFDSAGSIYMPGVDYQTRNTVTFDLSTAQTGKPADFVTFLKKILK
ncbi:MULTISPECIES: hypothetical protein [Chitinophagaceae]